MTPDLFLSIQGHVGACPACSELCRDRSRIGEDYENLLAALMPDPNEEAYHLTKAELAGYVQKSLDEVSNEVAAAHLELCAECAREAEELRGRGRQSPRRQAWAGTKAFMTALPRPARVASLALLVLGLILATVFFLRTRDERPAQHSAERNEGPSLNANQPEAIPSPSQPAQPGIADDGGGRDERAARENSNAGGAQDDTGAGQQGVESLPPHLRRAVMSALATQRLERPQALDELNAKGGTLLGDGGGASTFALLSPVGKVIQSSRPTFRWKPLAGADSYVVAVVDRNLDEVATSGALKQTQWTVGSTLRRGGVYSWQVTAFKDGKAVTSPVMPAPPAKFMVLDHNSNEELSRARRALPNHHLGLGVLYARAGLLDEAERQFQAELKSNPRSTVAIKLLQSLRDMKQ